MKTVFSILFLLFSLNLFAQNTSISTKDSIKASEDIQEIYIPDDALMPSESEEEVFIIVEQMPEYPGGTTEMNKFIWDNVNFTNLNKENKITTTIIVSFIVEKDGSLSNYLVLRDIDEGFGEEVIRVLKMMPKWNAGKQRGKPVRVKYKLPIKLDFE